MSGQDQDGVAFKLSDYLLDPQGVIRSKWLGYPGVKAIDAAVESLLDGGDSRMAK